MPVPRVCVLGGGISGLSTALFLRQKLGERVSLSLIDNAPALGGKIASFKLESPGGKFQFEQGPRSLIRRNGLRTLQMIHDLGLSDQILPADHNANRRFFYDGHKLRTVSPSFMLKTNPSAPFHAFRDYLHGTAQGDDESIYAFMGRRFGPDVPETMEPMILGIFAGDIRKLSMRSCFPDLWEAASLREGARAVPQSGAPSIVAEMVHRWRHGGVPPPADMDLALVERWKKIHLYNFKDGGLQVLLDAIQKDLEALKVEILSNSEIQSIDIRSPSISIKTQSSSKEEPQASRDFDYVVSALPADVTAKLTTVSNERRDASEAILKDMRQALSSIPTAPIYVVYLGFSKQLIPKSKRGFGFLVPSRVHKDFLGITFDSCTFPEHNQSPDETRLTVMIGGDVRPDLCARSAIAATDIALRAAHETLGITDEPAAAETWLSNIPQYTVGHHKKVAWVETTSRALHPNFVVSGSGLYGVSVNACVSRAHDVATELETKIRAAA